MFSCRLNFMMLIKIDLQNEVKKRKLDSESIVSFPLYNYNENMRQKQKTDLPF